MEILRGSHTVRFDSNNILDFGDFLFSRPENNSTLIRMYFSKEYIKCLENRVAVLENQNKALIEELKSLKELYTG